MRFLFCVRRLFDPIRRPSLPAIQLGFSCGFGFAGDLGAIFFTPGRQLFKRVSASQPHFLLFSSLLFSSLLFSSLRFFCVLSVEDLTCLSEKKNQFLFSTSADIGRHRETRFMLHRRAPPLRHHRRRPSHPRPSHLGRALRGVCWTFCRGH